MPSVFQSRRILRNILEDALSKEQVRKVVGRIKALEGIEKKVKKSHSQHVEDIIKSRIRQDKGAEMDALNLNYRHSTPSHQTNWPQSLHPDMQSLLKYQGRPKPPGLRDADINIRTLAKEPLEGSPYQESTRKILESRAEHAKPGHPEWVRKKKYPFPFDAEEASHTEVNLKPLKERKKFKAGPLGLRKRMAPVIRPRGKMSPEQWSVLYERVVKREMSAQQASKEAFKHAPPVERELVNIQYPKRLSGEKVKIESLNLPIDEGIQKYAELKAQGVEGLTAKAKAPVDRFYIEQGKPHYVREVFKNIEKQGERAVGAVEDIKKAAPKTAEAIGEHNLLAKSVMLDKMYSHFINNKRSADGKIWTRLMDRQSGRGKAKMELRDYFRRAGFEFMNNPEKLKKYRKVEYNYLSEYFKLFKDVIE